MTMKHLGSIKSAALLIAKELILLHGNQKFMLLARVAVRKSNKPPTKINCSQGMLQAGNSTRATTQTSST